MKIFISWSGDRSKAIAEKFRDWLPAVLQAVKPYFTPSDIEKGARWNSDIAQNLEQCKMGIFILTKDNLESPWLMFEAGAISKSVESSKVCPILFDNLEASDIVGPLTQFQASGFEKEEIHKIVRSINSDLGEAKLTDKILDDAFETWWPKLKERIEWANYDNKEKEEEREELREDRELLEEILELVRFTAKEGNRGLRNFISNHVGGKYDVSQLEKLLANFMLSFEGVFEIDWAHTESCLKDDAIQSYISLNGTFLRPLVQDEGSDWGNRGGLLKSYRELADFMRKYEIANYDLF